MSRNLLSTNCVHCGHDVELVEEPRKITEEDAGPYLDEFQGMEIADAICPMCKAEYLAWVNPPESGIHADPQKAKEDGFFDLSYRRTFNDESYFSGDLPKYSVEKKVRWVRKDKTEHHPENRDD